MILYSPECPLPTPQTEYSSNLVSSIIARPDTDTLYGLYRTNSLYERSWNGKNAPHLHHRQNIHRILYPQSSSGRIQTLSIGYLIQTLSMGDPVPPRMPSTHTTDTIFIKPCIPNHRPAGYRHSLWAILRKHSLSAILYRPECPLPTPQTKYSSNLVSSIIVRQDTDTLYGLSYTNTFYRRSCTAQNAP